MTVLEVTEAPKNALLEYFASVVELDGVHCRMAYGQVFLCYEYSKNASFEEVVSITNKLKSLADMLGITLRK